tara:strand:- start:298 stop:555 length:258 start_codon:yes stop_codon:yes gene_type:complete
MGDASGMHEKRRNRKFFMGTANPQAAWNEVGLLSPGKTLERTYLLGSGLEKVTENPVCLCGKYDSPSSFGEQKIKLSAKSMSDKF